MCAFDGPQVSVPVDFPATLILSGGHRCWWRSYAQVLTLLDRVLPQIHSFGFAVGHPKLWEDLGRPGKLTVCCQCCISMVRYCEAFLLRVAPDSD